MSDDASTGLRILVLDDEPNIRQLLIEFLKPDGYGIDPAGTLEEAKRLWNRSPYDLVLADKNLPDGNSLEFLNEIIASPHSVEVLIITAYASLESAIDALRLGVTDYLIKPFENADDVRRRVRRAATLLATRRENRALVNELKKQNERLEALAIRDALTGLFNHAYFQQRLANEISRSGRYRHDLGLMFIDIDNFKNINDTLGHQAGDAVLQTIAEILRGKSREVDYHFRLREHDIAARYGGDEFVLMLPETPRSGTSITAERLRSCVEETAFGPRIPRVTLSVGVASFPQDGTDRDSLIAAADIALYAAKNSGRNRVIAYTPDIGAFDMKAAWEKEIDVKRLEALHRCIADRAFDFVYQPIVAASSGEIMGYEALCRPKDGVFATPLDLLTTAEHVGKVTELGRILRERAIDRIDDLPGHCLLFLNTHPQELNDPVLLAGEPFLTPWLGRIVLEVNDSRNISDQRRLRETMAKLKERGFRIALDDLCTGYLGLNSLARLEPDFVRLHIGALRGIVDDQRAQRLVRHFLEYSSDENIPVVAKGVETRADHELAINIGCPLLQGFYYAKGEPSFRKPEG